MTPTTQAMLGESLRRLKGSLVTAMEAALHEFEIETGGLTPSRITIDMVETTSYGDPLPRHTLGDIEIDLGSY